MKKLLTKNKVSHNASKTLHTHTLLTHFYTHSNTQIHSHTTKLLSFSTHGMLILNSNVDSNYRNVLIL